VNLTDFDGNTLQEKIFAQRHNLVGATPVLAFFDLNGKRVVRHTGPKVVNNRFLSEYIATHFLAKWAFFHMEENKNTCFFSINSVCLLPMN
jgi:hypothetical protein